MKRPTARTLIVAASLGSICAAFAAAPSFSSQDAQPAAAKPESATPASQPDKPKDDKKDEKPKDEKPKEDKPKDDKPSATPGASPSSTPSSTTSPSPAPAETPSFSTPSTSKPATGAPKPKGPPPPRDKNGRIVQPDDTTTLAFKGVPVEQVLPFIVETTGKVVVPRPELLGRKITIFNDQPIKRSRALDLVFFALQQEGIAVIETREMVILIAIADLVKGDVPVLGPDESTLDRDDFGTVVEKIFQMKNGSAKAVVDALEEAKTLPDYAKITLDANTNQIVVMGNIGLLQRIEKIVAAMDKPSTEALASKTFALKYADAEKIAQNIKDLFSEDGGTNRNNQNQNQGFRFGGFQPQEQNRRQGRGGNNANTPADASLSQNLRVTANSQQNAVTVVAEPRIITQVEDLINDEWDKPLEPEKTTPRTYHLKYIDAVKARDLLEGLYGRGTPNSSSSSSGNQGGGGFNRGGGGGNQQSSSSSSTTPGIGRLAGSFTFEALPDSSTLVVISKSPDNFEPVDRLIEELDQPQDAGLPTIIELKHASAEELAEQLNTLLAQEGTQASIQRQAQGLTSQNTTSPFANDTSSTTNTTNTNNNQNQTNSAGTMTFWWSRARPPTDFAGTSNLVSKVRIVPVWRQNALMITAPKEYRDSLATLINDLDRPGRQVLISGIVFEISLDDATALGLRWSNSNITPTNQDNVISTTNTVQGTKNQLINNLFDTSVLNTNVNLNVLLQALSQKTNVTILSEPRIFTSDNQEAEFFDGQDVPFVNQLQTNNNGNPTQSFDYKPVGIRLAVRPRITVKKDVDLNINLVLSSVAPGQTIQNALIVDRRETTTHLIVKDGQTVVISGIMRHEDSEIKRKIPLLGDIPLIGSIFTSIDVDHKNTELIAFVTPVVIENTDQADKVYEKDRNRLLEMRKANDPKSAEGQHDAAVPTDALPPPKSASPDNPPTPSIPPNLTPKEGEKSPAAEPQTDKPRNP